MATKYEVTIPFKKEAWYTGYAKADSKQEAASMVYQMAVKMGWVGKPGKIQVSEVK